MSELHALDSETSIMNTRTIIRKNGMWYELHAWSGARMFGRSTSFNSMVTLQNDLREKGYTEMESNI